MLIPQPARRDQQVKVTVNADEIHRVARKHNQKTITGFSVYLGFGRSTLARAIDGTFSGGTLSVLVEAGCRPNRLLLVEGSGADS